MASTNPARGMRDFLPADVRKRNYVIGIIKEVYESYGFEPLETPSVENLETLMGKYGDEGNQLVFKILKRGEKLQAGAEVKDLADLALRYDLTVPLARVVANNKNELPKYFKRYQIQPVWRADRPARGRFREFYQCDVDAIGSHSMVIEVELINAVSKILTRLGFLDFTLQLNHRKLLTGLLNISNVPSKFHTQALVSLDKLDKIGTEGVIKELTSYGLSDSVSEKLIELLQVIQGAAQRDSENYLWNMRNHLVMKELFEEFDISADEVALDDLAQILILTRENESSSHIKVNPSLARGLSYYTGTIMEINVPDLAGSLGGGGRYDGLIGMFGKEQIPACGFSLGLERILVVMEERGMFPPEIAESTPADVLVTIWSDETVAESLKLATELRSNGLRVTLYPEAEKLGKQIKYADSIRVPFVCVLGESEIAEGKVTLKDMRSGDQSSVNFTEAIEAIKNKTSG